MSRLPGFETLLAHAENMSIDLALEKYEQEEILRELNACLVSEDTMAIIERIFIYAKDHREQEEYF